MLLCTTTVLSAPRWLVSQRRVGAVVLRPITVLMAVFVPLALSACSTTANTGGGTLDSGGQSIFSADSTLSDVNDSQKSADAEADVAVARDAVAADSVTATPDTAIPDAAIPDAAIPDTAIPDAVGSDSTTPTTCPGAPGCSCAVSAGCNDGLCIDTPLGRRCADSCLPVCKAGFTCFSLKTTAGTTVKACAPSWGRLCQPCDASKDCQTAGVSDALCVDQGKAGRFCGAACATSAQCPDGYSCKVANSTEGGKAKQCLRDPPAGSTLFVGECSCWPASKADGLASKCYAEQVDLSGKVVGKCPGQRICGQTGLGQCILTAAKAEVCDGVDNNCNGTIDENANGCASDEACVKGQCSKSCSAVNGGWSAWAWTACSTTCGGGIRTATRTCTAPASSCGGTTCVGSTKSSESCNTQACAAGSLGKGTTVYNTGGKTFSGTVPAGVSLATIAMWGGGGGGCFPGDGGGSGYVRITIAVKTGDTLSFRVASGGGARGGGGGASYALKNGSPIAVAAGGGGGGCDGCSGCGGAEIIGAGGGGGMVGGAGQDGTANNKYTTNSGGGGGATAAVAGLGGAQTNKSAYSGCEAKGNPGGKNMGGGCAGGSKCKVGPKASAHIGGKGCIGNGSGGAGGSGYRGGGSGAAKYTYTGGGGGGGSSWATAAAQVLSTEGGNRATPGGVQATGYAGMAGRGGRGKSKANKAIKQPESGSSGLIVLKL